MNILNDVAAGNHTVDAPSMPPMDREGKKQFAAAFFVAMPGA